MQENRNVSSYMTKEEYNKQQSKESSGANTFNHAKNSTPVHPAMHGPDRCLDEYFSTHCSSSTPHNIYSAQLLHTFSSRLMIDRTPIAGYSAFPFPHLTLPSPLERLISRVHDELHNDLSSLLLSLLLRVLVREELDFRRKRAAELRVLGVTEHAGLEVSPHGLNALTELVIVGALPVRRISCPD